MVLPIEDKQQSEKVTVKSVTDSIQTSIKESFKKFTDDPLISVESPEILKERATEFAIKEFGKFLDLVEDFTEDDIEKFCQFSEKCGINPIEVFNKAQNSKNKSIVFLCILRENNSAFKALIEKGVDRDSKTKEEEQEYDLLSFAKYVGNQKAIEIIEKKPETIVSGSEIPVNTKNRKNETYKNISRIDLMSLKLYVMRESKEDVKKLLSSIIAAEKPSNIKLDINNLLFYSSYYAGSLPILHYFGSIASVRSLIILIELGADPLKKITSSSGKEENAYQFLAGNTQSKSQISQTIEILKKAAEIKLTNLTISSEELAEKLREIESTKPFSSNKTQNSQKNHRRSAPTSKSEEQIPQENSKGLSTSSQPQQKPAQTVPSSQPQQKPTQTVPSSKPEQKPQEKSRESAPTSKPKEQIPQEKSERQAPSSQPQRKPAQTVPSSKPQQEPQKKHTEPASHFETQQEDQETHSKFRSFIEKIKSCMGKALMWLSKFLPTNNFGSKLSNVGETVSSSFKSGLSWVKDKFSGRSR